MKSNWAFRYSGQISMRDYSISKLRTMIFHIVDEINKLEVVRIWKNGKIVAYLLSVKKYEEMEKDD